MATVKKAISKRVHITDRLYAIIKRSGKLASTVYGHPAIFHTRKEAQSQLRVNELRYEGCRVLRLDDVEGTLV